jgi:signal transduction histidine kinase
MTSLKKLCVALLVNLALIASASAAATPEQAQAMVEKAIAYIDAHGTEQAYKAFNTPGSEFFDGELYIFAYDFNGLALALGANPKVVGKNLIDMKSADGKPIIRDFIDLTKAKGEGWYDYKWINPETKKVQDKTSYLKKVPGADALVGCGIYK